MPQGPNTRYTECRNSLLSGYRQYIAGLPDFLNRCLVVLAIYATVLQLWWCVYLSVKQSSYQLIIQRPLEAQTLQESLPPIYRWWTKMSAESFLYSFWVEWLTKEPNDLRWPCRWSVGKFKDKAMPPKMC